MNFSRHWFLYALSALLGTLAFGFLIFINQRSAPDPVIEDKFADLVQSKERLLLRKLLKDGMIALRAERYDKATSCFQKAHAMASTDPNTHSELIASILGLATIYVVQDKIAAADQGLARALTLYNPNSERYNQQVTNAFNGLADELGKRAGRGLDSEECYENERKIRKLINGAQSEAYMMCNAQLGAIYLKSDRPELALPAYEELVDYKKSRSQLVESCYYAHNLGICLLLLRREREAVAPFALALRLPSDTNSHRQRLLTTRVYVAWLEKLSQRKVGADNQFRKAFQQFAHGVSSNDMDRTAAVQQITWLADAAYLAGDQKVAVSLVDQAILLCGDRVSVQQQFRLRSKRQRYDNLSLPGKVN
ncbi:MAG: hypothetical protein K2X93_26935 [Candidatus Obscuribacterales bacterium]|nr:hypothetical protein [Candidatus Obscuribacterales bacterium]